MKKRWLMFLVAGLLMLLAACAPQTPPVQSDPAPEVDTPVEDPPPPVQSDPADVDAVQKALSGDWSYSVGVVQTDLTFTEGGFEVTTTVSGVSSHSAGTYEVGDGVILLRYDHGGEKTVSYIYKEGTLTLGQIQ